ncbi:ABC transporter ATP-binding protein [Desulfatitalea alkaliphila]|uniref:ATP-binding cassette domain-containing protein n=1 Tax=Desulfatitalea alkaliphila TaxID=2929485 RepID=A0AA41R421_9BACT|nr:ATP-binding cassette domain-containing protein [Desulfatitalea alkaliphila]MCJ8501969.1 ATP-binding cassette domain-containing protein [Desulfatitalea alkaliphila]
MENNDRTIIEVRDLEARYGETTILKDVNIDVRAGEILAVIGGSGCGKTTLLKHMVGLSRPYGGHITIDGIDITNGDEKSFARALRKIGILFQGGALFSSMTIAENVALPLRAFTDLPPDAVGTLVRMKLCSVDLGGYEHHLPSELSGGMIKRAALARSLALNPEILFLDEPTAGLDPVISAEIEALIMRINHQFRTTMIIITHSLDIIYEVAHRVVMLDKSAKGIIAQGDPKELRRSSPNAVVRQFFNRQANLSKRSTWQP